MRKRYDELRLKKLITNRWEEMDRHEVKVSKLVERDITDDVRNE